jgi:hypothetical protein
MTTGGTVLSEMLPEDDDDQPAKPATTTPDDDAVDKRNELLIEIWKQGVETQKHFNEMCVKSRQLGLTFVAASLGAALYLFIRSTPAGGEGEAAASHSISAYSFSICGHTIVLHISLAIIIAAAAAVYSVSQRETNNRSFKHVVARSARINDQLPRIFGESSGGLSC